MAENPFLPDELQGLLLQFEYKKTLLLQTLPEHGGVCCFKLFFYYFAFGGA
jgi:hypothetical protein